MELPKLFNLAELARLLFPGNKDAQSYLYRKLHKRNGLELTDQNKEDIKKIIEQEVKKIE